MTPRNLALIVFWLVLALGVVHCDAMRGEGIKARRTASQLAKEM
jgi:hypothetical protein